MDIILVPILGLLITLLGMYRFCIIASVILNLLLTFKVINPYNRFILAIGNFFHSITAPLLVPIRRVIPPISGFDVSPILAILFVSFTEHVLIRLIRYIG